MSDDKKQVEVDDLEEYDSADEAVDVIDAEKKQAEGEK
tara:strand:+ start:1526 stop:1639 length:114 start_codon:yes stop_codon:yes gene_type:complete